MEDMEMPGEAEVKLDLRVRKKGWDTQCWTNAVQKTDNFLIDVLINNCLVQETELL